MQEEMLKDRVRTHAYRNAIIDNKHLFRDKIIMDVGCGTGILSMFAVQAGARHVYAVEKSGIYKQAIDIIAENNMSDRITVINQRIEDITQLPDNQHNNTVDIIISEWMGYFLLYESMLDSVIYARDTFLRRNPTDPTQFDGIIMPDQAAMYLMGIEDSVYRRSKLDFWSNVYGFKMNTIQSLVLNEPLIDMCESKQCMTNAVQILNINLYTIQLDQLNFTSKFELNVTRHDTVHALIGYFTCCFTRTHTKISWSTSPKYDYTHWKQTVFYLPQPYKMAMNHKIRGVISVKRAAVNPRELDIDLTISTDMHPKQIQKQYKLR